MPNISDVALRAGVSAMTVSRYLNSSGYIGKSTAEKIGRAVSELRYKPNQIAKSLQNKKTRNIAVMLGNVSSPMSALAIKGIESVSFKNNYNLLVCNTDFSPEKENIYVEMLMQKQIDGLILAPCSKNTNLIKEIIDRGIALLFLERFIPGIDADYISFDFRKDSEILTSHLIEQGASKISVICREADAIHNNPHLAGFYDSIKSKSVSAEEQKIYHCHASPETGWEIMNRILNESLPDAVYITSSVLAIGALRCCRERGINIPGDILMASFDSFGEYDDLVSPRLTCNKHPALELGVRGAELLLTRISSPKKARKEFQRIVLSGELIKKESTNRKLVDKITA